MIINTTQQGIPQISVQQATGRRRQNKKFLSNPVWTTRYIANPAATLRIKSEMNILSLPKIPFISIFGIRQ